MPIKLHSRLNLLLAAGVIGLFFIYPVGDADLGWHLRYGESLLSTGHLLRQNIFSYVLPQYQWVNHSWLYDPLVAWLFRNLGFLGLSLMGALLIALSFYLVCKHLDSLALLFATLMFIFFGQHLLTIGLRSQLISLILTAYLWFRLQSKRSPTRFYDLPLVFLFWANLHGQYLMGLGVIWLTVLGRLINKPRPPATGHLMLIACLSTLITLINPYGYQLFITSLSHLTSPLTANIFEWMPWEIHSLRFIALFSYGLFLMYTLYKTPVRHRRWDHIFVFVALFILSLKARRVIPFFLLVSLSTVATHLAAFMPKPVNQISRLTTGILITGGLFLLLYLLPSRHLLTQTWSTYCQTNVLCSEPLIDFLRRQPLQGNLLNAYRLGGHLIYRSPQTKVFIDGRMTLWQDLTGHYPFQDYLDMIHAQPNALALINQYQIRYVLAHPEFELIPLLENTLHWTLIYSDPILRLYQSPYKY